MAAILSAGLALTGVEVWGATPWWQGVVAGAAVAFLWHSSSRTQTVMSIASVVMVAMSFTGKADDLTQDGHIFFNGMTVGALLGFAASAWWRWKALRPWLVARARSESATWLLRLLGETE